MPHIFITLMMHNNHNKHNKHNKHTKYDKHNNYNNKVTKYENTFVKMIHQIYHQTPFG